MANKFTVYTAEAIARIYVMKAAGKKSPEIARAIGTTRNSLSARMSQLGITKAKPRAEIAA
jgi:transcriptional regulator